VAVASGHMKTLTPYDLLQGLPLHGFTSSPIVHTRRVPPFMAQSRLGAFRRQRRELFLLPASQASIFNPLDYRELRSCCCHQCLRRGYSINASRFSFTWQTEWTLVWS